MSSSKGPAGYAFAGFVVDVRRRMLVRASGEPVPLAPKAFDTLLCLVEHAGELLGKRTLIEAVWPDVVVEENNLNQCITALRRALGERPGEHRFIVTDPGRGYRFVAPVTPLAADGAPAPRGGAARAPPPPGESARPPAGGRCRAVWPRWRARRRRSPRSRASC